MKKFVGAVFLTAVILEQVAAENVVGIRGGVNVGAGTAFSSAWDDDLDELKDLVNYYYGVDTSFDTKTKVGGGFGIFYRFLPVECFGLQTGLDFNFGNGKKQICKVSSGGISEELTVKVSYSSMEIPILACANFQIGRLGIVPMLGFNLSIPLGKCKEELDTDDIIEDAMEMTGAETSYKYDMDSGVIPGMIVGCDFSCGITENLAALLNLRYEFDFTQMKIKGEDVIGEMLTRRGLSISLGLQYAF